MVECSFCSFVRVTFRELQSVESLQSYSKTHIWHGKNTQLKYFLSLHTVLLNHFIYNEVKASQVLHGGTMRVALSKNWVKGISIHLIRQNCCLSSCLLPTCKKNHVYLTDSQYYTQLLKNKCHLQHLSHSGYLIDYSKTSDFFFWLIFRVSSPPLLLL